MLAIVGLTLLTLLTSAVTTGLTWQYAVKRGLLDQPNHRSSHSIPTPRGGGVGILAATVVGQIGGLVTGLVGCRDTSVLVVGMLVLGVVGWLDDRHGLSPSIRFGVQLVVAVGTAVAFGGLPSLTVGGHTLRLGGSGLGLAVFGIVWSINLFNFMDGIDGLAGSQSTLVFGAACLLLALKGDAPLAVASLVVAAASAGFVAWNWPPAHIFMGDVGSGALGYAVAALAIASERDHSVSLLAFVVLNGVFVVDATFTLVRRILRGEKPWHAHRQHTYQRLAVAIRQHRGVTVSASFLTLGLAGLAAVATIAPAWFGAATIGAVIVLGLAFVLAERRARR